MREIIVLFLSAVLFTVPAYANAPVQGPTAPGSSGAINTISKVLRGFVAPTARPTQAKELLQLTKAIKAIEDKGVRMTNKRRLRIAMAAYKASKATGVDATLLIAVARMESDFRGLRVVSWKCRDKRYSRCVADCGITQHYISGPRKWVVKRCSRLARDYNLSFLKSAKELASHIKYCRARQKWNKPLRRCVLNRYNSGTFYRTARRCNKRWGYCARLSPKRSWVFASGLLKAERQYRYKVYTRAVGQCRRVKYKCLARAAYWKRVMCFDYGARHGLRAERSCRRMGRCVNRSCRRRWDLRDIAPVFYGKPLLTASR